VNDPTTAIQSLDRIHDLLRRIGTGHLPSGRYADDSGRLRLVVPDVTWAGYVSLSFDEIRRYGSDSLQVLRRLRAVVEELLASTAPDRHQPLVEQLHRLDRTVAEEPDPADGALAAVPDDQGLGAPSAPTR
jgi:uncharacterized membrane protein